jgi:hypothetical protein
LHCFLHKILRKVPRHKEVARDTTGKKTSTAKRRPRGP